jgi:hypothetical protein
MKRLVLALFGMTVMPAMVSGQDQGWASKFFTNNGAAPNALVHNFGNVAFGAQLTHKFIITNPYSVPFKVAEAKAGCGCVEMKKPDQPIPPRGTAELEAILNTRRIPPQQLNALKSVNVSVTMVSVPEPGQRASVSMATLTVSCLAKTNIWFNPDRVSFGVVPAGQSPRQFLDITNTTKPDFQITEVVANKIPLDAEFQPQRAQPGQVSYRLFVTLHKDAPAGEFKHEIQLKTNDPATPLLSVLVEASVQSALVAAPNNVDLGKVKVNTAVMRHVIVRGPGQPFKITGVTGDGNGIKVKLPDKAAAAQVVTIEYLPTAAGAVNKELTIKTDLNGGLSTVVIVNGEAVP